MHGLVGSNGETETSERGHGIGEHACALVLRCTDNEDVIAITAVLHTLLPEHPTHKIQHALTFGRRGAEAKHETTECIVLARVRETKQALCGGSEREGEEAVADVELRIPASWCGGCHGTVDGGTNAHTLDREQLVEVTAAVEDEPRFLAIAQNHVQRVYDVESGSIDDLHSTARHVCCNPLTGLTRMRANSACVGARGVGGIRVGCDGNTVEDPIANSSSSTR